MLFSVSIGSVGTTEPTFTARLPFQMPAGRTIKLDEDVAQFDLQGHPCQIALEANQYALTIRQFSTEAAAAEFLLQAAGGLVWLGLKYPIGFRFDPNISKIDSFREPRLIDSASFVSKITGPKGWKAIDGQYDSDQTIVRPEHKRLICWTTGRVTVRQDTPPKILEDAIIEAMSFGRPDRIFHEAKLRLAIDFYMSSHFDTTPAASFLNRFTTLEILVPDVPVHAVIQERLGRFIAEIRAEGKKHENQEDLSAEVQSVLSRLAHMRNRSIKSGLRSLIRENVRDDQNRSGYLAREVADLYDLRSELVHNGTADRKEINEGNNRLGEIVPQLLRTLFQRAAAR
jgi:hypothetical protein